MVAVNKVRIQMVQPVYDDAGAVVDYFVTVELMNDSRVLGVAQHRAREVAGIKATTASSLAQTFNILASEIYASEYKV